MDNKVYSSYQRERYLKLLSREYPNRFSVFTKLINLSAVLNMPKGTEHFISDIHGEYEAFLHILNNGSGVIKDKVKLIFTELNKDEIDCLCTLIYYPKIILNRLEKENKTTNDFYKTTILQLIKLANFLSSKYSRSKVRKSINHNFSYIIDELMHAKTDEDHSRARYHSQILETIIQTGAANYFICELCELVKVLSVDILHVLGDIFDRGLNPEKCMDLLTKYHNLDLQWGNHDVLWMGASLGSAMCAVNVLLNNIKYHNDRMLENGYGISLRKLALFSSKYYKDEPGFGASQKAITVIGLKLMAQLIKRHPEYHMDEHLILDKLNKKDGSVVLFDGNTYHLTTDDLPTIDEHNPYQLTVDEQEVVDDLVSSFTGSVRLKSHVKFLFTKGTMYKCYNGNLLYHGCVPLDKEGNFLRINCNGKELYGQEYLDYCETKVREAYSIRDDNHLDFLWYMWTAPLSPLSGRKMKLFERALIKESSVHDEPRNPYYDYYQNEDTCNMILQEFSLDTTEGHIINGHTPIMASKGEKPVRANGKLLVIDGGFCKAYQEKTGIAGYTLISSSHYIHLKAHTPFTTTEDAIASHCDIEDLQVISVKEFKSRKMVSDTDKGKELYELKQDLNDLLDLYMSGLIAENLT